MPSVLDWLTKEPVLRAGIRATKFLSTLDGKLLVTLIYKSRGLGTVGWKPVEGEQPTPADDAWSRYAKAMQTALSAQPGTTCVGVIGRSKNVRVVVGDSYVVETGIVLRDGRKLIYKQPEQAFSNPNGARTAQRSLTSSMEHKFHLATVDRRSQLTIEVRTLPLLLQVEWQYTHSIGYPHALKRSALMQQWATVTQAKPYPIEQSHSTRNDQLVAEVERLALF
jgi:hypothetical protein